MENQTLEPAANVEPVHIELGHGRVEIGQGHHGVERLPAILFGKNGAGQVGIETEGDRIMEPGECIAAITFRNRASLEVVAEKLDELRARIWPEAVADANIKTWRERVSDEAGQLSCFNALLAENSELRDELNRTKAPVGEPDGLGLAICILRSPGMAPQIKNPYGDIAAYVRALYEHNPGAEVTLVRAWSDSVGCQSAEDGREYLSMLDDALDED